MHIEAWRVGSPPWFWFHRPFLVCKCCIEKNAENFIDEEASSRRRTNTPINDSSFEWVKNVTISEYQQDS